MVKNWNEFEAGLRKVATALDRREAKLHPLTDRQRDLIRCSAKKQFEIDQKVKKLREELDRMSGPEAEMVIKRLLKGRKIERAVLRKVAASLSSVQFEVAPERPLISKVEESKELPTDEQGKPPAALFTKPKGRKKVPGKVAKKQGNAKLNH